MTTSHYSKFLLLSALICIIPVSTSCTDQNSNSGSLSGWFSTQNVLMGMAIGALVITVYKLYGWRELIKGVIDDIAQKQLDSDTQSIIGQIKQDKGNEAGESVEYVLRQLKAKALSYYGQNSLPVIRIKALEQIGLQCGNHVLSNLLTVHKLIEEKGENHAHGDFIKTSKRRYDALLHSLQGQKIEYVNCEFIHGHASKNGLNDILYLSKPPLAYGEAYGGKLFIRMLHNQEIEHQRILDPSITDREVPALLDKLLCGKSVINVAINSNDHWTAANIIYVKNKMKKPVIVLMDSRNNNARSPENYNEQAPLKYISDQIASRLRS